MFRVDNTPIHDPNEYIIIIERILLESWVLVLIFLRQLRPWVGTRCVSAVTGGLNNAHTYLIYFALRLLKETLTDVLLLFLQITRRQTFRQVFRHKQNPKNCWWHDLPNNLPCHGKHHHKQKCTNQLTNRSNRFYIPHNYKLVTRFLLVSNSTNSRKLQCSTHCSFIIT